MAYAVEKKVAKDPSRFGEGAVEGVAAPESARNAGAQTAFVPTLTLEIPGDATLALMLPRGDMMAFFERPISASTLGVTAILLLWAIWRSIKVETRARAKPKI